MDEPILRGFIYQHNHNDWSLWVAELSDEDRDTIEAILSKYRTEGCSARGDIYTSISDIIG